MKKHRIAVEYHEGCLTETIRCFFVIDERTILYYNNLKDTYNKQRMNKLTIIECFERTPIENMISCLAVKPEKVIFIGRSAKMPQELELYRRFLQHKKLLTKIEYRVIQSSDLEAIVDVLVRIAETEKECSFDLTGGDDLLLVAVGMVYERYRHQIPIRLHRFDLHTGKMLDCDGDGKISFSGIPQLSIRDHIALYNGAVVSSGISGSSITPELKTTVNALWNMSKNDAVHWNKMIGALLQLEKYRSYHPDPLCIQLDLSLSAQQIRRFQEQKALALSFLKILEAVDMISELSVTPFAMQYTYKNTSVKYCLAKSGNILELKVLTEAAAVTQNGLPVYHDCINGVYIEWDKPLPSQPDSPFETKNEIDAILMHHLTPVFISCKNGAVEEEELYKLNTVAMRFGGVNAKKVLIVTHMEDNDNDLSLQYFRQRAKDMGILLIDEARALQDAEWQQKLADIVL